MEAFERTLGDNLKLVEKILFCKVDAPPEFLEHKTFAGIPCTTFGYPNHFLDNLNYREWLGHPLGMRACFERVTTKYIYATDPDVLFLSPTDELYLSVIEKHDVSMIGVTCWNQPLAAGPFPTVINMMIRTADLPDSDFLKEDTVAEEETGTIFPCGAKKLMHLPGEYMVGTRLEKYASEFINPNATFDTGCYLYLWCKWHNLRWVGFLVAQSHHLYESRFYRNNFGLKDKLPVRKLIWHSTESVKRPDHYWDNYMAEWEKYKTRMAED